uniref:Uncharacterized protein n=1 Tax=Ciona intestinalis TaxID=7719 RepID=H2Y0M0_CIOIN
ELKGNIRSVSKVALQCCAKTSQAYSTYNGFQIYWDEIVKISCGYKTVGIGRTTTFIYRNRAKFLVKYYVLFLSRYISYVNAFKMDNVLYIYNL